jgi:hypothetical protein
MLQAMIDDSGTRDGSYFLLGALIAPVSNWIAFTEEWNAELDQRPRVPYFKLQDAVRGVEEFSGAGTHPELLTYKINRLSAIIQAHVTHALSVGLSLPEFNEHAKPYLRHIEENNNDRRRFKHISSPYFLSAIMMITGMDRQGFTEPVDVVFDEQAGEGIQVQQWWPDLRDVLSKTGSQPAELLVQGLPTYRRDQDFAPLQAANSFAWLVHRSHSPVPLDRVVVQPPTLSELLGAIPHKTKLIGPKILNKWGEVMRERFREKEQGAEHAS